MKLFYAPGACSLVVRIILNELNMDFKDELVDLKAKKTAKGGDFLSINPKGLVPALQLDDGEVITENQVILQYLADKEAATQLLPPVNHSKRYHVLEFLNYISTELHKTIGQFFNPSFTEGEKTKFFLPQIMQKFNFINKQLAKGPYLLGDEFTLPDAYLFVMLRWALHLKIEITPYKHIEQFKNRLQTRPSVIKSLKQEGLS